MKILCFGDSNTYGYDPLSFFGGRYPASHRWVDQLTGKLACKAIHAGENGREIPRSAGELCAFDRMLDRHKPIDLLLIMLGTNDLLQGNGVNEVVSRMETFLRHIDLEREKILLIAPPPMQLGEWVPDKRLIEASIDLSREIKALAQRLDVRYADAGAWGVTLTFDGVHFTEEGHSAFADGLFHELNKGN